MLNHPVIRMLRLELGVAGLEGFTVVLSTPIPTLLPILSPLLTFIPALTLFHVFSVLPPPPPPSLTRTHYPTSFHISSTIADNIDYYVCELGWYYYNRLMQ